MVARLPGGIPPREPGANIEPSTPTITQDQQRARDRAREAWGLGLAAIILCAMSACAPFGLLVALPLGWVAMSRARSALADTDDLVTEAYARTARITGTFSLAWSVFVLGGTLVLFVGYASIIALIVAAAGSVPPPAQVPVPVP